MRRWLLAIVMLVAVAAAGAAGILAWYDGERIRARLEETLAAEYGVALEVGRLERTFELRPLVRVTDLEISNARHSNRTLIEVERARFRVRLPSLLAGPVTFDDLEVSGVRIAIPVGRGGVRYWEPVVGAISTWLHRFDWSLNRFEVSDFTLDRQPVGRGSELLVSADRIAGTMPRLSALTLEARGVDANLETTLPLALRGTARLDVLELGRAGGELPMSLTARGGIGDEPLTIDVRGGNLLGGDPRERDPVKGTIRLGRHAARVTGTMSRDDDRHVDVDVELEVPDDGNGEYLRGRVHVSDPGSGWRLADIVVRRGGGRLDGDAAVTMRGERRHVDLDLELQGVDYPFHESDEAEPADEPGRPGKDDDLYAGLLDFIERFDARISMAASDSSLYGAPLRDVETITSVNHGAFELRIDTATVLDGALTGTMTVVQDAERTALTLVAALRGGDLATLVAALPALHGSDGAFDGNLELRAAGRETADVLSSMNGRASLYLEDGEMPDEIARWMAGDIFTAMFADFDRADTTPVDCAVVEFGVNDGQARSRRMVLDTGSFTLVGEGRISLPGRRLDIELAPSAKRFSLLSMRLPVAIGGPFDAIELDPDASEAATSLLTPIDAGGGADVTCSPPRRVAAR